MLGGILVVVAWMVTPGQARAEDPLTHAVVTDLVVEMLVSSEVLRWAHVLPVPEVRLEEPGTVTGSSERPEAFAFFGPGIDVSGDETRDGSVMLALKPKIGRRGGILRCTWRF